MENLIRMLGLGVVVGLLVITTPVFGLDLTVPDTEVHVKHETEEEQLQKLLSTVTNHRKQLQNNVIMSQFCLLVMTGSILQFVKAV